MIREIITPIGKEYLIQIPDALINKKVELVLLPCNDSYNNIENEEKKNRKLLSKTSGILKPCNVNPVDWQTVIRSEYER